MILRGYQYIFTRCTHHPLYSKQFNIPPLVKYSVQNRTRITSSKKDRALLQRGTSDQGISTRWRRQSVSPVFHPLVESVATPDRLLRGNALREERGKRDEGRLAMGESAWQRGSVRKQHRRRRRCDEDETTERSNRVRRVRPLRYQENMSTGTSRRGRRVF